MCLPFREGSCIWGGSPTSQVSHWESLQEETQQQRTMQVGSPESQHIQAPTETQTLNTSLSFLSVCLHWKPLGGWTKTSSWHMTLCSAWKLRLPVTLCCCCGILQSPGQGRATPVAPVCPLTWNLLSGALQGRQDGIIGSDLSAVECPCCLRRAGIGPSAGLLPLAFCFLAAAGCCWLPLVCRA